MILLELDKIFLKLTRSGENHLEKKKSIVKFYHSQDL